MQTYLYFAQILRGDLKSKCFGQQIIGQLKTELNFIKTNKNKIYLLETYLYYSQLFSILFCK